MKFKLQIPVLLLFLLFSLGCNGPEVIHDLSNASFELVDQDSSTVHFPEDYQGNVLVVGFIYTNCPDICPIISAKLSNISKELENPEDVHFVEMTFDPKRDTPSVLKEYMEGFRLDPKQFTMLTGDSVTVDSALNSMDITARISYTRTTDDGKELYFMNHTNRILIMDKQGRVRFEYPGSVASEKIVIEDINKLR